MPKKLSACGFGCAKRPALDLTVKLARPLSCIPRAATKQAVCAHICPKLGPDDEKRERGRGGRGNTDAILTSKYGKLLYAATLSQTRHRIIQQLCSSLHTHTHTYTHTHAQIPTPSNIAHKALQRWIVLTVQKSNLMEGEINHSGGPYCPKISYSHSALSQ